MGSHHTVIEMSEVYDLGAGYATVRAKLAQGEWYARYPGVFCSASAPRSAWQALRAACLFCAGVASHTSAAWVWGLLRELPAPVEISVTRGMRRLSQAIDFVVHRSRDLDLADTMTWNGIPVTKPLRTLVDLAATGTPEQLSDTVDTALAKRLVTVAGLEAEIARLARQGRPGVGRLRRHLVDRGYSGAPPPSVLEARARRLVRRLGLPMEPEVAAGDDGRYRLDLAAQDIKLAVEVDGYTWHFSPEHKRRDELRRQRLREAGWTVLVFDWRQLGRQQAWVGREIRSTYLRLVAGASQQASQQGASE